jgi:hypothetical protein
MWSLQVFRALLLAAMIGASSLVLGADGVERSVPLKVEGDTAVIVKSTPFKVLAPPGADLYFWTIPDSVSGNSSDNVLEITKAPKGSFKVRLVSVTIEIKVVDGNVQKRVIKETGDLDVTFAGGPGPGPDPDPDPKDPVVKALQEAYAKDTGTDKAENMKLLARLYLRLAEEDPKDYKTYGELYDAVRLISGKMVPAGVLPGVRKVLGAELRTILPSDEKDRTKAITDEASQRLKALFGRLGSALEAVRLGKIPPRTVEIKPAPRTAGSSQSGSHILNKGSR